MTTIYTDDFNRANSATWDGNWSNSRSNASQTHDISSNTARLATSASASQWARAIHGMSAEDEGEVLVKFKKSTIAANTGYGVVWLNANGAWSGAYAANGFEFAFGPSGHCYLIRRSGGSNVTTQTFSSAIAANTDYWLRMKYESGTIYVKLWAASGAEPGSWTYSAAWASVGSGVAAFTADSGTVANTNTFDDFAFDDLVAALPDVEVFPDPLEASATAPTATVTAGANLNVNAAVAAASAAMPGGRKASLTTNVGVTEDARTQPGSPNTNYGSDTTSVVNLAGLKTWFKFDLSSLPADAQIAEVRLHFNVTTLLDAGYVHAESADGSWSEGSITYNTEPAFGAVEEQDSLINSTGWKSVDLTDIAKTWGTNNGVVLISSDANLTLATSEHATLQPYAYVLYAAEGDRLLNATPLTADAAAPTASVSGGTGISLSPDEATADAAMPDATVEATDSVLFNAPALTAAATAPAATVSIPDWTGYADALAASAAMPEPFVEAGQDRLVEADVATADADVVEPEFSNQTDVQRYATTMFALAALVGVYDEADDAYVARVSQLTASNDAWLRLDETSGTEILNNKTGTHIADFVGSPVYGVPSVGNRKAVGFDGSTWVDFIADDNVTQSADLVQTVEFVFRTTKADQVLMSGYQAASGVTPYTHVISMQDGRLVTRPGGFSPQQRLDDGEWHYVSVSYRPNGNGSVLEIVIDRQLAMRRYLENSKWFITGIDSIGKGDSTLGWFEGDIMEVVVYGNGITLDESLLNAYAVFGDTLVTATAATATATSGQHTGRGNQKRALMLYYNFEIERFNQGVYVGGDEQDYPWTGFIGTEFAKFNLPGLPGVSNVDASFDWAGYKVFIKPVLSRLEAAPWGDNYTWEYFDEVTGEQRYIDLEEDLDVTEYDLVFFADLPPRQSPQGWMPNAYERLVESVRYAVDQGVSLWCPQPQLAADLGLIEAVGTHSPLIEPYDQRSSDLEQGGGLVGSEGFSATWLRANGTYLDTHYLNKYRIVGGVEGLTDLGGWIVDDVVYWRNKNPYHRLPDYVRHKHLEIPNGLQIGQELLFPQDLEYVRQTAKGAPRWLRRTVVGVPAGKWHVGTAIAKEQAQVWNAAGLQANPYADWTLAFAVQPGDVVKGRPIGGKVFVDFMQGTEGLNQWLAYQQTTPEQDAFDGGWDYDSRRRTSFFNWLGYTVFLNEGHSRTVDMPTLEESEQYGISLHRTYSMIERALNWLGIEDELAEGDERVYSTALTATATMPAPTVTAERSVTVTAQALTAGATIVKPPAIEDPDVTVTELPMLAQAQFGQLQRHIVAEPMEAEATMPDTTFNAGGEDVVLWLHTFNPTVYVKEDA